MDSKLPQGISNKLTPNDIKNKEFTKAVLGYSPKEVVEFLDMTAKTWERVQKNEKELLDRIQTLSDEILRWRGRESEFEKLRENAVREAHAIREKGQEDAAKHFAEVEERANAIRRKTEEWLEGVIASIEETERQKSNFVTAFKSALDSHYALLQSENEGVEPLGTKLSHFLRSELASTRQLSN